MYGVHKRKRDQLSGYAESRPGLTFTRWNNFSHLLERWKGQGQAWIDQTR